MSKVDLRLEKGCCSAGERLVGVISPFNRIVALEYDGQAVAGVAQCTRCASCWRFAQLDSSAQERAYWIAPLQEDALKRILEAYGGRPHWPVWVPPPYEKLPHASAVLEIEQYVLGRTYTPTLVILTKALANGRILAALPWDAAERYWLERLGGHRS